LPSGELTGITTSHRLQLHECEQFTDPLLYASCRRSQRSRLHRKPKGHILSHGHMPEQRVMLENEPHATFSDSPIRRLRAVQKDTSSIRFFQSGKNSQQRRLATTGRAEEGHEFAFLYMQADIIQHHKCPKALRDMVYLNTHRMLPV